MGIRLAAAMLLCINRVRLPLGMCCFVRVNILLHLIFAVAFCAHILQHMWCATVAFIFYVCVTYVCTVHTVQSLTTHVIVDVENEKAHILRRFFSVSLSKFLIRYFVSVVSHNSADGIAI